MPVGGSPARTATYKAIGGRSPVDELTEQQALKNLTTIVKNASNWLARYCCSYDGPKHGQQLREALEAYERARDGHGKSDR